jgi:hypothetical protein
VPTIRGPVPLVLGPVPEVPRCTLLVRFPAAFSAARFFAVFAVRLLDFFVAFFAFFDVFLDVIVDSSSSLSDDGNVRYHRRPVC